MAACKGLLCCFCGTLLCCLSADAIVLGGWKPQGVNRVSLGLHTGRRHRFQVVSGQAVWLRDQADTLIGFPRISAP